jgi:transcriptional regulator with XRE-family HTH domain
MGSRERPTDRGQRFGRATLARLGSELRSARTGRGLSIDAASAALGVSNAEVSRIERAFSPNVPLVVVSRYAAVLGLDLVANLYPGAPPVRDGAHIRLLADFRAELHPSLRWATEVPLPLPRDQRAWDAMIFGPDWRYGVEAETAPGDGQSLARRLNLKLRDGEVDGVLLLLRDTHRSRTFVAETRALFAGLFPSIPRQTIAALRAGLRPDGNAIVVLPYRRAA